ncbi:DNA-binding transcription factor yap1 [Coemansia sp. RSA 1591]|nr:DNA-binding transcription factor yap1 [Coemansia sp. RSA 1591]
MSTVEISSLELGLHNDLSGATPQKRATSTGSSDESHDDKKRKPGRRPITTEATTKRTAQNRAAQRAFRERKNQHLKGLEDQVKDLVERQERTERENEQLRKCIEKLQSENKTLKGSSFTYESAPVDFEKAITDLFDSSHTAGLDLSSTFGLQQAAVSGADLTQPGAMDRIQPQMSNGTSPHNATVEYPTASSGVPSLSGDYLSGIQMLASNQNISTGSFMDHLFDGSTPNATQRVSDFMGPAYSSRSPSTSATATTPGDMFEPLNSLTSNSNPGLMGIDAFKGYQGDATFASLIRQTASTDTSQSVTTPSLSELFSFSPSQIGTDGLINLVSAPVDSSALLANVYKAQAPLAVNPNFAGLDAVAASGGRQSPALPAYLMAYRNPDPISATDDGDQLEKLLLSSMYSVQPAMAATATPASLAAMPSSMTSAPINSAAEDIPLYTSYSSPANNGVEQQLPKQASQECTCRNCDSPVCDPCPKHGSPADLSEEIRDMAPQMMNAVCTDNNRLADGELDDLCSLMFKHAKCTEMQKRVEMAREKLKNESELELFNTKVKLAKQYGLQ